MTDADLWQPPPEWAAPPERGMTAGAWAGIAVVTVLALLGVAVVALVGHTDSLSSARRPLPRNGEEALRWQGDRVAVETGTAEDGRRFTFSVSRDRFGDLCEYLDLSAPPAAPGGDGPVVGGGGGGSCGGGNPMGFSTGSDGAVHGLVIPRITSVEMETPRGRRTVATKALPAPYDERRYFLLVLEPGMRPSSLVGRDASGKVVYRSRPHYY
jgi:hypothetical protein